MGANAITCGHCGYLDRWRGPYCANCGQDLAHACDACGFSNQVANRFCAGCGTRFAPGGSGRQASTVVVPVIFDLEELVSQLDLADCEPAAPRRGTRNGR